MRWHSIPGRVGLCAGLLAALWSTSSVADRIADISNTRHNFSASVSPTLPGGATRNIQAQSESQICAFCHTPHGASVEPRAPLWNRSLTAATYTPYTSGSLDAIDLSQPSGKSKLCLSCHDGTLAIGSVNVLNGTGNPNIPMAGNSPGPGGTIPEGLGPTTGYTRRLGTDLTNDHPISFTYDLAQFNRDGELRNPVGNTHIRNRMPGNLDPATPDADRHPAIPLEDSKVECISCHDPHIRDTDPNKNIKFLRANRFQENVPTGGDFDPASDIICVSCHEKEGWVGSAHASQVVANYRYTPEAAALREFPSQTQVWQAACLNCHDPHAVQGSRRLLREGTDGPQLVDSSGGKFKQGGNPAIEETCYACHSADGGTLQGQGGVSFGVPNIKTDFTTMLRHMPITNTDQPAGTEMHNIGSPNPDATSQAGKDFVESPLNMGKGNLNNRHAECTDCHNPHRVTRNRLFNANSAIPDTEGTHPHTPSQITASGQTVHSNLASGVLRGIWGVEPTAWSSTEFGSGVPIAFEVKRGDGGTAGSTAVSAPYVTREYQICMKCHSNYAYDTPPFLGSFSGGTPAGTNNMSQYTNQGMEYQSPATHQGEGTAPNSGADAAYAANNHRSWHPVMSETGRTETVRAGPATGIPTKAAAMQNNWTSPFNLGIGIQTMYCTDCHGSNVAANGTVIPDNGEQGSPWGPHGSNNDFLLKGAWKGAGPNVAAVETRGNNWQFGGGNVSGGAENHLCFKCHDYNSYGVGGQNLGNPPGGSSGFSTNNDPSFTCIQDIRNWNLHTGHVVAVVSNFRCNYCHIAVPHGWKNKVFLANLNDVGPEGGQIPGTQVRNNTTTRYENGPYYNGSTLKVRAFARSGEWVPANCGSAGAPGNGDSGLNWMVNTFGAGEGCQSLP